MTVDPSDVVRRLVRATNDHDLDGIVACFAPGYVNHTPAHPARGFRGPEQVRRNWTQILGGVPDIAAEVLAMTTSGSVVWSEWEMAGTRRDGVPHLMRGVIVFEVADDRIAEARFYLEPVDPEPGSADAFVRDTVAPGAATAAP